MGAATVIIFHPRPAATAGSLTDLLAIARDRLVEHQVGLFERAGAAEVRVVRERAASFGAALRSLAADVTAEAHDDAPGLVVLGAGAVPLLGLANARRLVAVAASGERRGLTNNRYSSDVCAVGDARVLGDLPSLPGDNALPRWLTERAGIPVAELPGRDRLALDLDTPLDLALLALVRGTPPALRRLAAEEHLEVPRLAELRAVLGDPRRELLVFGRGSSRGMALLERRARCRVRFLAEERGLRASSALAQYPAPHGTVARPPARHAGAVARGARRPRRAGRARSPSWPMGRSWTAASCWPTGWAPTRPAGLLPRIATRATCCARGASGIRGWPSSPPRPRGPPSPSCWAATRWWGPASACWREARSSRAAQG